MLSNKNKWWLKSFGFILFLYIISRIDISKTIRILAKVNPLFFILAIPLFFPAIFFKTWRWERIFREQQIRTKISKAYRAYICSIIWGMATPGKIGEIIKVEHLMSNGNTFGKSMFSVVIDRVFDVIFVITVGYLGVIFYFSIFNKPYIILFSVPFMLLIFIVISVFILKGKNGFLKGLMSFLIPERLQEKVDVAFSDFIGGFQTLHFLPVFFAFLLTAISWVFVYTQFYLLSLSININISLFYIVVFFSIIGFINILPVSILGIGTRDITLIYLFSKIDLEPESAVALSTLVLSINVINCFISLASWWIWLPESFEHLSSEI